MLHQQQILSTSVQQLRRRRRRRRHREGARRRLTGRRRSCRRCHWMTMGFRLLDYAGDAPRVGGQLELQRDVSDGTRHMTEE